MKLEDNRIKEFQEKMLSWYKKNGRKYPWRNTSDPYKIMIAEFLLQKTHVRKVEEVYLKIIKEYPTIERLAMGEQVELEDIIRPLGFLNRAERLISAAKIIVEEHDSNVPDDFDKLLKIKGIGRYIASAILIFAYDNKKVVVDTNVIRILENEFDIKSERKRPRTDIDLWNTAQHLAPDKFIKEFNWALLDYGAVIQDKKE